MRRYELTAGEAHAVLEKPACANQVPVEHAARRLVEKGDARSPATADPARRYPSPLHPD